MVFSSLTRSLLPDVVGLTIIRTDCPLSGDGFVRRTPCDAPQEVNHLWLLSFSASDRVARVSSSSIAVTLPQATIEATSREDIATASKEVSSEVRRIAVFSFRACATCEHDSSREQRPDH